MKKGSVLFLSITLICIAVIVVLIRWLIETCYIYIVLIIAFSIMILKYSTEKEKEENKEEISKTYIPKDINTKKNKKKEENIDNYDLEDWQKELVDDGSYEPYNFEEEELEDDDYYSEDDN